MVMRGTRIQDWRDYAMGEGRPYLGPLAPQGFSPGLDVEIPVWSKTHEASRTHWQDLFQAPISACSGIHNTQVAWNLRVGKESFLICFI